MTTPTLRPYLRRGLDVLFVALNPPSASNARGHYFSGPASRFFKLLHCSGLLVERVSKSVADDIVFGSTDKNYKQAQFGVVDLVEEIVETNSGKVSMKREHVDRLISKIRKYEPRFACVIHFRVRDALNRYGDLVGPLEYGNCGPLLRECPTDFVLNYFPNGNSIPDGPKLEIFGVLRDRLNDGT